MMFRTPTHFLAARHQESRVAQSPATEWPDFAIELDRTLRRIGVQRVRVTLACLMFKDDVDPAGLSAQIAERLTVDAGLAGSDPDGAVMAVNFGPRRYGPAGDADEAQRMRRWFRDVLRDLAPEALEGATVAVAHFWSDEWAGIAPHARRCMLGQPAALQRSQRELAVAS
ncbi:MAG: hypothetical protein AB7J30_17095 [Hyphomicrobium sp.]|uniref:hypothetical protein n=1 Tax=Hyphomicrobium sp. TaxID=82 RepID=UPI003D100C87